MCILDIYLDRIDYYYDEVEYETEDGTFRSERFLTNVDVDYVLVVGKHELDGRIKMKPKEYKGFKDEQSLIEYIKQDITQNIQ